MAYIDQASPRDRATSAAGVIAIHAAIGAALYFGLQITTAIVEDEAFTSWDVKPDTPPPPPPPPTPDAKPDTPTKAPDIYTPPRPLDVTRNDNTVSTTLTPPPPTDYVVTDAVIKIPEIDPGLGKKLADPIAAKPRNAPGNWVTNNDYRTSWINREWAGIAGFNVTIDTNGRVQNCTITQSTGHAALDEATCSLVTRRARFEAARDGEGNRVAGSYSSKVRWQIPD